MGQEISVERRVKYQTPDTAGVRCRRGQKGISAVSESYTHTWINICRYLWTPVLIRHSHIQKYCKYMHTYIQIYKYRLQIVRSYATVRTQMFVRDKVRLTKIRK